MAKGTRNITKRINKLKNINDVMRFVKENYDSGVLDEQGVIKDLEAKLRFLSRAETVDELKEAYRMSRGKINPPVESRDPDAGKGETAGSINIDVERTRKNRDYAVNSSISAEEAIASLSRVFDSLGSEDDKPSISIYVTKALTACF